MLNWYREFTVAQTRIEPANARQEIDRVLRTCWIEKRPVYLQLPSDVAGVRTEPITGHLDLDSPPSDTIQLARAISRMAKRISQASAPAFLLDADTERFDLAQLIVLLAETNEIPMAHLIPAKGVIDETHPLAIGLYRGAGSSPEVRQAIERSDCLICVGTRFTDVASGFFTHQLDPKSIIYLQPFGLRVGGDSFNAVRAEELLSGLLTKKLRTPFRRFIARVTDPWEIECGRILHSCDVWHHVVRFLQPGDVLVSDTGTSFFASSNLNLPEGPHSSDNPPGVLSGRRGAQQGTFLPIRDFHEPAKPPGCSVSLPEAFGIGKFALAECVFPLGERINRTSILSHIR